MDYNPFSLAGSAPFPVMRPDDPNRLTTADAYTSGRQAIADWVAAQRADAAARGLWNDSTGLPTQAGMLDAAKQYAGALVAGTSAPGGGIRAYHGSPHNFERFDTSKVGMGEGAQAYGHGLYFAENEGVARGYRDQLGPMSDPRVIAAGKEFNDAHYAFDGSPASHARVVAAEQALQHAEQSAPPGHMYEVNINANPEHFLDWDKPLSAQSKHVQNALQTHNLDNRITGEKIYKQIGEDATHAASQLSSLGIPGIRYLDQGSRGAGEGTSNHVVFDANNIEILRKYGLAGLMAGAGAAGAAPNANASQDSGYAPFGFGNFPTGAPAYTSPMDQMAPGVMSQLIGYGQ